MRPGKNRWHRHEKDKSCVIRWLVPAKLKNHQFNRDSWAGNGTIRKHFVSHDVLRLFCRKGYRKKYGSNGDPVEQKCCEVLGCCNKIKDAEGKKADSTEQSYAPKPKTEEVVKVFPEIIAEGNHKLHYQKLQRLSIFIKRAPDLPGICRLYFFSPGDSFMKNGRLIGR